MILNELKLYIEQQGSVSQSELAKRFVLSCDGVDAMLSIWIKKGVLSRFIDTNSTDKVTRVRYSVVQQNALAVTVTM